MSSSQLRKWQEDFARLQTQFAQRFPPFYPRQPGLVEGVKAGMALSPLSPEPVAGKVLDSQECYDSNGNLITGTGILNRTAQLAAASEQRVDGAWTTFRTITPASTEDVIHAWIHGTADNAGCGLRVQYDGVTKAEIANPNIANGLSDDDYFACDGSVLTVQSFRTAGYICCGSGVDSYRWGAP